MNRNLKDDRSFGNRGVTRDVHWDNKDGVKHGPIQLPASSLGVFDMLVYDIIVVVGLNTSLYHVDVYLTYMTAMVGTWGHAVGK